MKLIPSSPHRKRTHSRLVPKSTCNPNRTRRGRSPIFKNNRASRCVTNYLLSRGILVSNSNQILCLRSLKRGTGAKLTSLKSWKKSNRSLRYSQRMSLTKPLRKTRYRKTPILTSVKIWSQKISSSPNWSLIFNHLSRVVTEMQPLALYLRSFSLTSNRVSKMREWAQEVITCRVMMRNSGTRWK